MPKMKTHRGSAKRFRVTGTKKSPKRKRNFRKETVVSEADKRVIARNLGLR